MTCYGIAIGGPGTVADTASVRRWAALTALFTIPYGLALLAHERPPTGSHLLAGFAILVSGIGLLGCIGAAAVRPSRSAGIQLLVFQVLITVIAIGAILLQNLPFSWATGGFIVALVIPVVGAVRRFGPAAWRPNPRLGTTIPDLLAEGAMVAGAVALMLITRKVNLGLVVFAVSGALAVFYGVKVRPFVGRLQQYSGSADRPAVSPQALASFKEASSRVKRQPADVQAIAMELSQRLSPEESNQILPGLYYLAATTQGMTPMEAARYMNQMTAQPPPPSDQQQPLAG